MKRYIFDEVATFEEATVANNPDFRYGTWPGELPTECTIRANGAVTWLRAYVLEGSPEAIAEAMIMIGNNALADPDAQPEEPIPDYPDTLANLRLSEADFR